jgi:hypothetical protein
MIHRDDDGLDPASAPAMLTSSAGHRDPITGDRTGRNAPQRVTAAVLVEAGAFHDGVQRVRRRGAAWRHAACSVAFPRPTPVAA